MIFTLSFGVVDCSSIIVGRNIPTDIEGREVCCIRNTQTAWIEYEFEDSPLYGSIVGKSI